MGGSLAIVSKDYFLHQRDAEGKLLPIIVSLGTNDEAKVTPIPDGELSDFSDPKKTYGILANHIIEPKITAEELQRYGKSGKIKVLIEKLLEVSELSGNFRGKSE